MTVTPGLDRIVSGELALPRKGAIGFLTNHAARTMDGRWGGSAILEAGYEIAFYLAPEHGLEATAAAGEKIPHERGGPTPALSMYGADLEAVQGALPDCDLLLVDLLDAGCRYYTYNWTIRELMRLAEKAEKPVVILDRPNPLGGAVIEGNLPEATDSAVCASPVPVRHGLTIGELARYNRRHFQIDVDLSVVPARGWRRDMVWDASALPFVPPSPSLRSPEALALYPGTCLVEGTNVSEGRGTEAPFQLIGAPFVDAAQLAGSLEGVEVGITAFTPTASKWAGEVCQGVSLRVPDPAVIRPVELGLALVAALRRQEGFEFLAPTFDALAGTSDWREQLANGAEAADIAAAWRADEVKFRADREDVLLY